MIGYVELQLTSVRALYMLCPALLTCTKNCTKTGSRQYGLAPSASGLRPNTAYTPLPAGVGRGQRGNKEMAGRHGAGHRLRGHPPCQHLQPCQDRHAGHSPPAHPPPTWPHEQLGVLQALSVHPGHLLLCAPQALLEPPAAPRKASTGTRVQRVAMRRAAARCTCVRGQGCSGVPTLCGALTPARGQTCGRTQS
jgi:hypothetical protein